MAIAGLVARHAEADGLRQVAAPLGAGTVSLGEDGEEAAGGELDDALPLASADPERAGAGDELFEVGPGEGALAVADLSASPILARAGARVPAMIGSRLAIVMALVKFSVQQISASSAKDSSERELDQLAGLPQQSATSAGVSSLAKCFAHW